MPIEWWALTKTAVDGAVAADDLHDPAVRRLREPAAAELRRGRHAQHAERPRARRSTDRGDVGLAVDRRRINLAARKCLTPRLHVRVLLAALFCRGLRVGESQVGRKAPEEQLLGEAPRLLRAEQVLRLRHLLLAVMYGSSRHLVVLVALPPRPLLCMASRANVNTRPSGRQLLGCGVVRCREKAPGISRGLTPRSMPAPATASPPVEPELGSSR